MTDSRAALPTYDDVAAAARRLEGHAHVTPVLSSRTLDERLRATLFLKAENLQRGGAFKFRAPSTRSRGSPTTPALAASSPTPRATTPRPWRWPGGCSASRSPS